MAKKETEVAKSEVEVLDDEVKAEESTALVSYEDELAKYAVEATEQEALGGTFVSMKAGIMKINGNPCAGNKLDCIVIASTMENAYYPGKYDANNTVPPKCYAFGDDDETMAPHPDVKHPESESCLLCPRNQWPDDGTGKECKNVRRLALLPADAINDPDKIMGIEQIYAKLPVTSVKSWGKYVHAVATEFKRPPFAVITTISTEPDEKTQFKVILKCKANIPTGPVVNALIRCHNAAKETVKFPYPTLVEKTGEAKANEKF